MVQSDLSQSGASNSLNRIVSLMAKNPELEIAVPSILEEISQATNANAVFYLLFDEPRTVFLRGIEETELPEDEDLLNLFLALSAGFHSDIPLPATLKSRFESWYIVPIFYKKKFTAVLSLLYNTSTTLSESHTQAVTPLIDCVTIVTHNARTEARHAKQIHNQNEFVRIVSHDLRSPLTSIKGFASMLESMGELGEKQLHFVEKILTGVTQMTSLVDNIQDAGRYDPETGFYEMERAPTDLVEMVRNIVKNHLVPAEKQELNLVVNTSSDVPIISVDATMLERSIINLVDNAIKYTPNGGRIEVGVRKDQDTIVISVADNGYGISEEHLRRLFQRHYRIRRREHKRVKGIGLGLFIVRSVARRHGGDAFVESVEGSGATFGIRIPLAGENLLGNSNNTTAGQA
jgi:signal transduction histidine kinase